MMLPLDVHIITSAVVGHRRLQAFLQAWQPSQHCSECLVVAHMQALMPATSTIWQVMYICPRGGPSPACHDTGQSRSVSVPHQSAGLCRKRTWRP